MSEMNIPYGTPYKDMSEMNNSYDNPNMDMVEMDNAYVNPNMDMVEKKPMQVRKMVLAMAYVLDQTWETPYDINKGLERGTIFPGLDKPFLGGGTRP